MMPPRRSPGRAHTVERADPAAARAAAVALLTRRDLASEALRARLCRAGFEPATAAGAVAELAACGIVDDRRFAENYVTWHAGRGQGPIRIGAELRRLGVSAELVQAVLDAETEWRAHALRVRATKFGGQKPASWAERARQARFLQYRGFSADHIRAAIGADFDLD